MTDGSTKCKLSSLICHTCDCGTPMSSEKPSPLPPSPPLALYLIYSHDSSCKHWQELSLKLYIFASTLPCHALTCHDWLRSSFPPSFRRRRFHLSVMRCNISVRTEQREWESGSVTPRGTGSAKAWRRVPLLCETELALWKVHVKQKAHSSIAAVWTGRRYRLSQQHHYRQESNRLPSRLTIDLFSAFYFLIFEINVRQVPPCAHFNLYLLRRACRQ